MRPVTLAFLLIVLAVPAASAQSELTAEIAEAAEVYHLISIVYDVDRYVYDLYYGEEDEAVLYHRGALVVRSESAGRIMVVLGDAGHIPATAGPNALFLTPPLDTVAQFIPYVDDSPQPYQEAKYHALYVFECADDLPDGTGEDPDPCSNWTRVPPMDRGDGLDVIIVPGPELGGTGGGGRTRPDDDG